MHRRSGLSARTKLTISYAGFLLLAGVLLLAVMWVFVLRWLPTDDPRSLQRTFGGVVFIGPSRADLLRGFTPAAATALAFLLVFGLLGGWILAGRMLAPLTRIADAARMAGNGSLSHRIRMKGPDDEFRELADVFDAMLEQLESHVAEQQRFAANASHELRTPLAITRTLLDVARDDPTRDQGELIERLHAVNTRAIDLTEALLLLSRSDGKSFTREPVDLSLIAEEAAETLLPLAEKRQTTLDVTGETTQSVGSAALLLRMMTNLVQNAIVHNLPAGGTVTIHTEPQHGASVLRVENTGHPLPSELVPALTEPFQRGTERVRTDEHAGVGLGLAIVHSIVRAHDGTLALAPRPTGGLLVTIRLPDQGLSRN
ncbi:sensor histidine kinase [Streptomyces purpurascens]|uniref:sensor histidine kinase n=1 Tax=Streptomyces purpurascens TaxID=1924 RepID=UPI0016738E00|nr:HAMP domain-containing sensor histidine kinase [Streptomyces purpurascens]MCE7050348.1 HAMP domain-containing histidine kinase [Streptomyces purpurascens]GHA58682.1 two-component sensor histidine kinase [Streptomyces purpurascens]